MYWEEHTIRRQLVHDWATGDSVRFLITAMAWGFGTSPYGPYRVRSMLVDDDGKARLVGTLDDIVDNAAAGPRQGFGALWKNRRPRVPRLGTAFGTKVLYFAGYHASSPPPLIFDSDRVERKAPSQAIDSPLPNPQHYVTSKAYEQYCEWCTDLAAAEQTTPVVVEWALFEIGRHLKNPTRKRTDGDDPTSSLIPPE